MDHIGHGGQTKDTDGDESDGMGSKLHWIPFTLISSIGYDETIYPVDFRYNGHIVDDDMHAIMCAEFPYRTYSLSDY